MVFGVGRAWAGAAVAAFLDTQIAGELGISESCLRRWMDVADVDDGPSAWLSTDEKAELVAWRRKNPVLELEVEMPKRLPPTFAKRPNRSTERGQYRHRELPHRAPQHRGMEAIPLGLGHRGAG